MFYYHIWVRSAKYRGSEALTYSFNQKLQPGSLVNVPLKEEKVLGIVLRPVTKPSFPTKNIISAYNLKPMPAANIKLANWLQQFYAAPIGVIMQLLLPQSLGPLKYLPKASSITDIQQSNQPTMTSQQEATLSTIEKPDTYVLHGRTGSGKTRVYTELASRTLKQGKSVLVLSPEIGLTSQLAASFMHQFGEELIIFHSQLTPKERQHAWLKILSAEDPLIVIGTRSTLFTPLHNIGLIVVDESHDQAYKQGQAPYYHAVRVASQLSKIHNSTLILGSATPSVADYYLALHKEKRIMKMEELAIPASFERRIAIIDLKDREQFSRTPHISLALIQAITESLEKGEQSLIYLNRRGTARITLCQQCGWQSTCPNCDLPLTLHGDTYKLRCHICGFSQPPVIVCPNCANPSVLLKSFGTKAIVDEVQQVFPEARILRFDTDNLKSERLESHYEEILSRKANILVGTQILAKGLDLPHLSTLGIIAADSSLYLPDFTAHERTYQLLTQVLGRVGRGHTEATTIIQTYYPDSPILQAALENNWDKFYEMELEERKKYSFPPFCHLLKLTCRRASARSAEKTALSFKEKVLSMNLSLDIDGPAPAFHERSNGKYAWQLVIKARRRSELLELVPHLPAAGWTYDIDPIDLL